MTLEKADRLWESNFLMEVDKQNRRPIIPKHIQKQLIQDWMYIDNGKYNEQNWRSIFQKMKKSKVKRLILQRNDRPNLIKQISNINFTQLNVLNLKSNRISSIQALSFISFPNIEWLYLDNNHIISLHPLVKNRFNALKKIHFNENHIKQINLDRMNFGKYFMSFQAQISSLNKISVEDISFIVKINCLTIRTITFCAKNRIKQENVYDKIQDRFNYAHLYDPRLQMAYNAHIFI